MKDESIYKLKLTFIYIFQTTYLTGGGEYLPSTSSTSDSFCSPWMTAIPNLKRSAYDVAFLAAPGCFATITEFL